MIVRGVPSIEIDRPTHDGSASSRSRKNDQETRTLAWPPDSRSRSSKTRPSAALHGHHAEEVGGDGRLVDHLGVLARRERGQVHVDGGHRLERSGLARHVEVGRPGDHVAELPVDRVAPPDHHHPVGVRVGRLRQQRAAHVAEHRGVHGDGSRQHDHGSERVARAAAQRAQHEAQVDSPSAGRSHDPLPRHRRRHHRRPHAERRAHEVDRDLRVQEPTPQATLGRGGVAVPDHLPHLRPVGPAMRRRVQAQEKPQEARRLPHRFSPRRSRSRAISSRPACRSASARSTARPSSVTP